MTPEALGLIGMFAFVLALFCVVLNVNIAIGVEASAWITVGLALVVKRLQDSKDSRASTELYRHKEVE